MSRHGGSQARRENLVELDSALQERLLGLDEPVDRSNWAAVVRRSKGLRRSRYRSFAVVASAAAALSVTLMFSLVQLFGSAEHPGPEATALRVALQQSGGSGLVVYAVAERASFLDSSDDRLGGRPAVRTPTGSPRVAALVRSLSGGPFHVPAALVHAAATARHVTNDPLPGDQALVSVHLFTSPGLETTAGSAVLTCRYGFDRNAYCDGAVDLEHGGQLSASGTLNPGARRFTLMVSSGLGRV